jgi:hypothetical protein
VAESAAISQGGGLVFLLDSTSTTEHSLLRPDGTYEPRPNFHDFGSVADGEKPSYVFRMRNTDPNPLAIKRVNPSCGCTVPSVRYLADDGQYVRGLARTIGDKPLLVVPPDAVLEIELRVDSNEIKTKNADKLLTVTISTDSPNGYYINLEAHILVETPFNVVPSSMRMGRIPRSAGGEASVEIVPAKGFHRRVTEILQLPDDLQAEITYTDMLGIDKWTLTARFYGPLDPGRHACEILVGTETEDGEPSPPIRVNVLATVVEDMQFDPGRFVFRAAEGERFTVRLRTLLEGHRFAILEAEVPAEHAQALSVHFEKEGAGSDGRAATWLLTLAFRKSDTDWDYPLRGEVRIGLDDPQHEELHLGYVIHEPQGPARSGG